MHSTQSARRTAASLLQLRRYVATGGWLPAQQQQRGLPLLQQQQMQQHHLMVAGPEPNLSSQIGAASSALSQNTMLHSSSRASYVGAWWGSNFGCNLGTGRGIHQLVQQKHQQLCMATWQAVPLSTWVRSSTSSSTSSSGSSFHGRVQQYSTAPTVSHNLSQQVHTASTSSQAPASTPGPVGPPAQPVTTQGAAAEKKPIEGVCRRKNVQCGWKKIDFVLRMIRRSTVDDAMAQLAANPKRAAVFVSHAIANARNNAICAGGDPQRLYVAEAFVTKGQYEKRLHFMSKGYRSLKITRKSHLNVRVRQMDKKTAAAVAVRRKPKLVAPLMQRMYKRQRMARSKLVPAYYSSGSQPQQQHYSSSSSSI